MKAISFRIWFGIWPLLVGVFLPYIEFPHGIRLVNVPWGLIFGFGLFLIDLLSGLTIYSPWNILGVIVWPLVLTFVMFMLGGKLDRMSGGRLRRILVLVMIISSLLVINISLADSFPWSRIPTFYREFFVVW